MHNHYHVLGSRIHTEDGLTPGDGGRVNSGQIGKNLTEINNIILM